MPVCVGRMHPRPFGWGGGGFKHNGTPLFFVYAQCSRPSSGVWVPYNKATGRVCGLDDLRLPPAHD